MASEINREALLIYLDNIRTLETIIQESDKKTIEINDEISKKKNLIMQNLEAKPHKPLLQSSELDDGFNSWKNPQAVKVSGIMIIILGIIILFMALQMKVLFWIAGIFVIIGISMIRKSITMQRNDDMRYAYYNREYELYETRLADYKKHENELMDKVADMEKKPSQHIKEIKREKSEMSELLKQAYSANIIPLQFRNIQGVYYLYDYLSTSSQSLSDALMQCNLDAIKQKLDEIINLQSESIVQQAQANAALYEQNQRILETAQVTMENTAVAAKYAQITAVNSELSLRLQRKQLAYQRAEFWLN